MPSIVRDWIKGQVTAIEVGVMPLEHPLLPHMLAHDGTKVIIDRAVKVLKN